MFTMMMSARPTGTSKFGFPDSEGSTRLWEEHPNMMREALARHDALLRGIIETRRGHIFKTMGDAFDAAFEDAIAAVAAAAAIQQAVQAEVWTVPGGLKVRAALHTGTADARGGDYFGQTLNRGAGLLAARHGEQILLSEPTRGLAEPSL